MIEFTEIQIKQMKCLLETKTIFHQIQTIRSDGYPKIVEIIPSEKFIHGAKDPNFEQPISKLNKEYK